MRVLQVNNHHALRGGSERVYLETGRLLASKGHTVAYLSTAAGGQRPPSTAHGLILPANPLLKTGTLEQVKRGIDFVYSSDNERALDAYLRMNRPDIAHLHIYYGQLSNSVLSVLRRHRVPCVMSVHEYRLLCPNAQLLDGSRRICHKCVEGNYIYAVKGACVRDSVLFSAIAAAECKIRDVFFSPPKLIDRFIFVSKFAMRIHLAHRPQMRAKATHLYNFVDLDAFRPSLEHEDYFLFVGRISREKGLTTLLTASQQLGIRVKVVGVGDQLTTLQEVHASNPCIEFLGFQEGETLQRLIRGAKFVCVPSEWYENNPMSIIEAFAYGTPVVGAAIGGIPELVINGENGFLFAPGDTAHLARTLSLAHQLDREAYRRMSFAARRHAEAHHSSHAHYSGLMDIYAAAANGAHPNAPPYGGT